MKKVKHTKAQGFVIGAVHSNSGKTVLALGIMEALRRRGVSVQPFKAGPDYIDPGHHSALLGVPSYNLDTWMMGSEGVKKTFSEKTLKAGRTGVVEGVMGLYDGRGGVSEEGSSAHLAKVLNLPVLLVVDSSGLARSAGALIKGFEAYDQAVDLRWVVFNRVGSRRHAEALIDSVSTDSSVRILGCIPKDASLKMPARHLGLVTSDDIGRIRWQAVVERAALLVEEHLDLDSLCASLNMRSVSESASGRRSDSSRSLVATCELSGPSPSRVRIAVARDKAFCFYYEENLDILKECGAELVFFSPLKDKRLPSDIGGIYLGGGYPELYARRLEANASMRDAVKAASDNGLAVFAECGGLMYLGGNIEDISGRAFSMSRVFPWTTKMLEKRKALGYREVAVPRGSLMLKKGGIVRGHEFHYSELIGVSSGTKRPFSIKDTKPAEKEGFVYKNTLATYVHLHFASNPEFARGFVRLCATGKKGSVGR